MKRKSFIALMLLSFLFTVVACSSNQTNGNAKKKKIELIVSAAASLNDALTEIKHTYEKEHADITIKYNFGASGTLQQQISQGAPVDLFISAAEDKFQKLIKESIINKENSVKFIKNELVLIKPKSSNVKLTSFEDLLTSNIGNIAIGIPESVPAGLYARETLKALNMWNQLESKFIYGKDVRQVLSYVETGNVDAGIVYQTDALISKKSTIVATADIKTHSPIIYPLGMIKATKYQDEVKAFYEYLQTKEAMDVLEKYGFTPLN